jgi:hypothetical protein
MPSNYENINGQNQTIYQTDADNDEDNNDFDLPHFNPRLCSINGVGDKHLGYIGFRNSANDLEKIMEQ